MFNNKLLLFLCIGLLTCIAAQSTSKYKQKPCAKKVYNIVDLGAVADGKTLNTKIIQPEASK